MSVQLHWVVCPLNLSPQCWHPAQSSSMKVYTSLFVFLVLE